MLIPYHDLIKKYNIQVSGILHIGAHECEELKDYLDSGVASNNIYWVEGQEMLVNNMKTKGIPNIYHALIDIEDDKEVTFNISNNGQSSSILEFGSHSIHHPQVHYVSSHKQKTTRLDSLIETNNIPIDRLNFLNLDIQGVELRALQSMEKYLQHINYIYTEVNTDTRIYQQFGWGDAFYIKK